MVNDLQSTVYWIVINISRNATTKCKFKDTLIQLNTCNAQNFLPLLSPSSVVRSRTTDEGDRSGRKFWKLYVFNLINASLNLHFTVAFLDLYIYIFKINVK